MSMERLKRGGGVGSRLLRNGISIHREGDERRGEEIPP
jgi:hypothetical protein